MSITGKEDGQAAQTVALSG